MVYEILGPMFFAETNDYLAFTHEKHKNNYYEMNASGMLYQITGEKKYAQFVLGMLKKYAEIYPTLGTHPAQNSETPGKLFWQALNEAVWLFHTANAYDCVYNFINLTDRTYIEKNLFYPMTEFQDSSTHNIIKVPDEPLFFPPILHNLLFFPTKNHNRFYS